MGTSAIFDFIDGFVFTYGQGEEFIDALFNGEMSYDDFAKMASEKRKAFDASVFECCENDRLFKSLELIYERLKPIANHYSHFPYWKDYGEIDTNHIDEILKGRELCEKKYHEIRGREIILAVTSLEKLLKVNGYSSVNDKEEVKCCYVHFEKTYNNRQLEHTFNYLMQNGYLYSDSKLEDFVFYFSGKGNVPICNLKWVGTLTDLALFIFSLFPNEEKKWEKTKLIFGVNARFATLVTNNNYRGKDDPFEDLRKSIKGMN